MGVLACQTRARSVSAPLHCACGKLRGAIAAPEKCTRIVCFCKDCQAFAHYLGQQAILDQHGGSAIVIATPAQVTLSEGREHLACMALSGQGMLRWYASCCNTPIGNTTRNRKLAFVGLSEACFDDPVRAFGPVRMRSLTKYATSAVEPSGLRAVIPTIGFAAMLLRARLSGSYRRTPFFHADGVPVFQPTVLSADERHKLP